MLKNICMKLKKIVDIGIYLFVEKGLRGGISYIAKDILKQTTNTWKIMTLKNRQNIYCTLTWVTYMVGQWVVILLMLDLSG